MTAESTETTETTETPIVGVGPDFPVVFEDPAHARLTWEWDDMHMPFANTPLAADWTRVCGQGFGAWKEGLEAELPARTLTAIWNGYAYFAFDPGATGAEREAHVARSTEIFRAHIEVADVEWRDRFLPELRAIYAAQDATPVDDLPPEDAAEAWERAWAGAGRAWRIHFIAINGPYQVLDDLADLYEAAVPGAAPGESLRLIQGQRHELLDIELGMERLTELADGLPHVAAALRSGTRDLLTLSKVQGGGAFADAVQEFLSVHGHMGQSVDDLAIPSWFEAPERLVAEVAKRLDHRPESAEARRERLAREADALADGVRTRLADRPDELARFEHLLERSRAIGPITETHNYWIDRGSQSHLRRLVMRYGARLAREGVIDRPDDVFYLTRGEVPGLLRTGEDRRAAVAERRALHERQRATPPPRYVGKAPDAQKPRDRFDGERVDSDEAGVLKGTGASAGVVRGPARVVLTSAEFDRILPGDVIVCPSSNPSWVPVFTIAAGLVTNTGGVLSHAAVVAREFGLPAVVGVQGATTSIPDGRTIEIDGTAGTVTLL